MLGGCGSALRGGLLPSARLPDGEDVTCWAAANSRRVMEVDFRDEKRHWLLYMEWPRRPTRSALAVGAKN
jgi:hypothetical protein